MTKSTKMGWKWNSKKEKHKYNTQERDMASFSTWVWFDLMAMCRVWARPGKHTWRDLAQYKNCKLNQNGESIFYCTFKVHSKVTFQSRSTEHVRLMLNQAWWTRLAIVYMSHPKSVQTLERFFAPNQSQSESEKNDTEEEQCINQEEMDEDRRKLKKSRTFQKTWLRDHTWLRDEKEAYVYQ